MARRIDRDVPNAANGPLLQPRGLSIMSKRNFREHAPWCALASTLFLRPCLACDRGVLVFGGTAPCAVAGREPSRTFRSPTANAYSTSLRYDSSGNLYAWDGLSVWEQSGGTGTFNNIGSVTAGNSADAGPISFSQDGQTPAAEQRRRRLLDGSYNGVFWTMPASGGAAVQVTGGGVPYTYDAVALPAASTITRIEHEVYRLTQGTSDYSSSSLSIFDAATGTNQVVIDNGPGATTSIAINPKNDSVYVGVGYGPDAGKIYSFSLSQIDSAYSSGTPIDFLSAGTLFNPTGTGCQSGAGMFFDNNGYLFSGGDGITVFRPDGTICYDQASGAADGYYDTLTYNPANNEVLAVPYGSIDGHLYNAADFEPGTWTSTGHYWKLERAATTGPCDGSHQRHGTVTFRRHSQHADHGNAGRQSVGRGAWCSMSRAPTATRCPRARWRRIDLGHVGRGLDHGRQRHPYDLRPRRAGRELGGQHDGRGFFGISGNVSQTRRVSALSLSGDGELILSGTDDYTGGTTVERRDAVRDELQRPSRRDEFDGRCRRCFHLRSFRDRGRLAACGASRRDRCGSRTGNLGTVGGRGSLFCCRTLLREKR